MKKKVIFVCIFICMFLLSVGYSVFFENRSDMILDIVQVNVEALAYDENDSFWWCESYVTDHYVEKRWDYSEECYGSTIVDTYDCSKGVLGSCEVGYLQIYYDCGGNETGRLDRLESGSCW